MASSPDTAVNSMALSYSTPDSCSAASQFSSADCTAAATTTGSNWAPKNSAR